MRLSLVLLAGMVAVAGCRSESASLAPNPGEWVEVAPSPLSPRARATVAWTGSEILVVGGDEFPCPSHMDCAPPDDPALSDGALYDPTTNTWRRASNAPMPVRTARPASLGGDVFLLAWSEFGTDGPTLLQYTPGQDVWTAHPLPPSANLDQIVATDSAIVLYPSTHELGPGSDLQFDPRTETWTELPGSPLGAGFNRKIVWANGALYLFDHELVPSPGGASGPSLVRAARLGDVWETLPTGETLGADLWLVDDQRAILPALGCADGGASNGYGRCIPFGAVFDTATDRWSELPDAPQRGEKGVTYSGALGTEHLVIVIDGQPMFDATTNTWFQMPALDAEGFHDVTAAERNAFAFGGVRLDDGGGVLLGDAWIWRPPTPE